MIGSASSLALTTRVRLLLVLALASMLGLTALALAARAEAAPLSSSATPLPGATFQGGDGDQVTTVPYVDWQTATGVITRDDPQANDNIFTGGDKESAPGDWSFTTKDGGSTPLQSNILTAYVKPDPISGSVFLNLAFTRQATSGTTYLAFELNQRSDLWNNGKANVPCRTTGDILVSLEVNGNTPSLILQKWTSATSAPNGCALTGSLSNFDSFTTAEAQGAVNSAPITNYLTTSYPWPGGMIGASQFIEASLNLTTLLDDVLLSPCFNFGSIWAHTRSSTEDSAQMQDYIAPVPFLVQSCSASGTKFNDLDQDGVKDAGEPGLSGFRIWADYDNDGILDAGEPFDDTDANGLYSIGNIKDPSGTYSLREKLVSGAGTGGWNCSLPTTQGTGGDFPCAYLNINGTTTPNVTGRDFGNYKNGVVEITKVADAESVSAGEPIGFTITVTNTGEGQAKGVTVTDTLPTQAGLSWTESPDNAECSIAAGELTCNFGTMNPGTSKSVHITSPTTKASCATIDNTAEVTSTQSGSDEATDSVAVECPDISVLKEADAGSVSAGEPIGFTITVTNDGPGKAFGVELADELPEGDGLAWTIDGGTGAADCEIAAGSLACDFGTLDDDETVTVHISSPTTAQDCAEIDNTAIVTADNDDQEQSTDSVEVLCPDISVVKTPDAASVSAGEDIGFLISVTNDGPGKALGVTLDDPLPTQPGLAWEIDGGTNAGDCEIDNGMLSCDFGTLDDGETVTVHISSPTTAASCATIDNTATVSATNDGSESSTGTVAVECPDIAVLKTADASSVSAGQPIGFLITVTNDGPGTATDVELSDTLPAQPGLAWAIDGGTNAADCQIAGGTLSCDFGDLEDGAEVTVHISSPTTSASCASIDNTATVTASNDDPESSTATTDVQCTSVLVTKEADEATVSAGEEIGFTITVTNSGPGQAFEVELTDTLPAADGLAWTIDGGSGAADCEIANGTLSCDFGTLADDEVVTVHISSPTTAAACGTITNTAQVTTGNDGSPQASDTVTVECPDISVLKQADAGTVTAGEDIGFTITVTNDGPGKAFDVELADELPAGDALAWEIDGGTGAADCEIAAGTLSCDFGTLDDGESYTVHVSSPTTAAECATIDNTATLTASNDDEASSTASVVVECPDISVLKTADASSVSAGEPIGFEIEVANDGPGTATDVKLSDPLPDQPGLAWEIDGGTGAADCEIADGTLSCEFGDLEDGAEVTVHISSPTTQQSCATIDNTATVTAANDDPESSTATTTVQCTTVLVTKEADAEVVTAGEEIGFLITVTNDGPGKAFEVKLTDELPDAAGLAWEIDGGTGAGDCEIAGGTLSCDFGTLDADASRTVHISSPTTAASCGTVDNTAQVTTANDGSPTAGDSVTVECPDIAVLKQADADSVTAGQDIGFTITVSNDGPGTATNVTLTDPLPDAPGLAWEIDGGTGAADCEIADGALSCDFGDLEADTTRTVHISSPTTAASCATIDNTATVSADNDDDASSSDSVEVVCPPGQIAVVKDGPATVYHGDQATFTFAVSNPGQVPLTDVTVADDTCAPVTGPTTKTGGNDDDVLDPGETWGYSCTMAVPAHQAGEANPIVNTVTATGTDPGDRPVTDTDTHSTLVLHPAIDIEKTGPASATVGDTLSYTLTVTNPGDVPFPAGNVVVTDPRCTQPPVLQGKGGDASPGSFDPGDTWTYTCSADTTGQLPGTFVNTATVRGTDGNGRSVTDTDDFPTQLVAQQVIPGEVVRGTARLSGPSGCVKKAFRATVRGRRIASVTFFVDGKKRKTITAEAGQRTFKYKIRPNALGRGVHRVTARVRFVAASETKTRTLRLSFQRCARQVVEPRFTG